MRRVDGKSFACRPLLLVAPFVGARNHAPAMQRCFAEPATRGRRLALFVLPYKQLAMRFCANTFHNALGAAHASPISRRTHCGRKESTHSSSCAIHFFLHFLLLAFLVFVFVLLRLLPSSDIFYAFLFCTSRAASELDRTRCEEEAPLTDCHPSTPASPCALSAVMQCVGNVELRV